MGFGSHKNIFQVNKSVKVNFIDNQTSFKEWSEYYYKSAEIAAEHDIHNRDDNSIVDNDSLPTLFMYRHSIELLLKTIIINQNDKKKSIDIVHNHKHDLNRLFNAVDKSSLTLKYSDAWFDKFFNNINRFDYSSDLFRYPFSEEFLSDYENKSLDIQVMFGLLSCAYNILYESFFDVMIEKKFNTKDCIKFLKRYSPNGEYIHLAPHGMGYCHLWQIKKIDSYKQIKGYHSVANLLYENYSKTKSIVYFIPMAFMYRNLIELIIKDIGQNLHSFIKGEIESDYLITIKPGYLKTHRIKKGLWKNYKIIFVAFAENNEEDLSVLKIIDEYILSLDKLDKHSDKFRYPTNKNLDFQHNDDYDPEVFHLFMEELYQIFEGMIMHLQCVADSVNDMLSEYASNNDYF